MCGALSGGPGAQGPQHLVDALAGDRMTPGEDHRLQRFQYKTALGQPRMGQLYRPVENLPIIIQQVQIQGTRGVKGGTLPPQGRFDFVQSVNKAKGLKALVRSEATAFMKGGSFGSGQVVDLVEGRQGGDFDASLRKRHQGSAKVLVGAPASDGILAPRPIKAVTGAR